MRRRGFSCIAMVLAAVMASAGCFGGGSGSLPAQETEQDAKPEPGRVSQGGPDAKPEPRDEIEFGPLTTVRVDHRRLPTDDEAPAVTYDLAAGVTLLRITTTFYQSDYNLLASDTCGTGAYEPVSVRTSWPQDAVGHARYPSGTGCAFTFSASTGYHATETRSSDAELTGDSVTLTFTGYGWGDIYSEVVLSVPVDKAAQTEGMA